MDGILRKEITNIDIPIYTVTNLESNTTYNATVAAVYVFDTGLILTSCEGTPLTFKTRKLLPFRSDLL